MEAQKRRILNNLTGGDRTGRLDAIEALALLKAGDFVDDDFVREAVRRILNSFLTRDQAERLRTAACLEACFGSGRCAVLARRLAAVRMEETDERTRESLLSAHVAVLPSAALIAALDRPDEEHLKGGFGLLMIIEQILCRVRHRCFTMDEFDRLEGSLRRARALRGSHIARPFLWRLESVISLVTDVQSKFRS